MSSYLEKRKIYTDRRKSHWNKVHEKSGDYSSYFSRSYHNLLGKIYKNFIPDAKRILELGCGQGGLLASLRPSYGVGVDFSSSAIDHAKSRHENLTFICDDVHGIDLGSECFDYIVLSDLVDDLFDVQTVLENLKKYCNSETRIILNYYSRLWEIPLRIAKNVRLSKPMLAQNWLTRDDVEDLMHLAGLEGFKNSREILFPIDVPILSGLGNRFLSKIWPFNHFAMTNFMVARLQPTRRADVKVTVVVPARNEAGNIEQIIERTPEMGLGTELVFVEGNSQDDTFDVVKKAAEKNKDRDIKYYQQTGKGKGDAVRLGYDTASGEVLMILDADMTVPPEDLPRFYEALISGKGEFVNGVRLVYPMEEEAMRFLNLLGNKFFSFAFSYLLGQPIKDTLCGTKVLTKENYSKIAQNRKYFGEFDPFGDFDLLFGSAKQNLKIIDLPIRYQERTYGDTNIDRWSHGWLLLKMTFFAAKKIKYV